MRIRMRSQFIRNRLYTHPIATRYAVVVFLACSSHTRFSFFKFDGGKEQYGISVCCFLRLHLCSQFPFSSQCERIRTIHFSDQLNNFFFPSGCSWVCVCLSLGLEQFPSRPIDHEYENQLSYRESYSDELNMMAAWMTPLIIRRKKTCWTCLNSNC